MSVRQRSLAPCPPPSWRWILAEFLSCLLIWLIGVGALFLPTATGRSWLPADPALAYPIKKDTVADAEMAVLSLCVPLFGILVVAAAQQWHEARARSGPSLSSTAAWIFRTSAPSWLGMLLATGLAEAGTNIIKVVAAEPRPDFLARCVPDATGVCTGGEKVMWEGMKAFPSGHASLTTAGMLYLTLHLRRTLLPPPSSHLPVHAHGSSTFGLRLILSSSPMLAALLMCVTRVADNKHDWWDVSAGFLLGAACVYATFSVYHPRPAPPAHVPLELERGDSATCAAAAAADAADVQADVSVGLDDSAGERLRLITQTPEMEEQRAMR